MSRGAVALLASALFLAALVPLGRWERDRARAQQASAMRGLLELAGPELRKRLSATRVGYGFDCLLYRRGDKPFAIELCFDPSGRIVAAVDRRGGSPIFWSLRGDAEVAPAVPVRTLLDRFHEAGVLCETPSTAGSLPVGFSDAGPQLITNSPRLGPVRSFDALPWTDRCAPPKAPRTGR